MVAAKVRERLAVSKETAQKFYVLRFNLRKLNDLEVRKRTGLQLWRIYVMART